jgi:hypothetical protein
VNQPKAKDLQKEIDIALSELEERVDRLRALYEQYFMGYEKIEPGVQRKDVDRRFAILRKMQIRNTAQRFRFNVITQKFNTYAMYWGRICRQIEEGTYKRHIARAQRKFASADPKRRAARDEASVEVELTELDENDLVDMDAILAEADAATDALVSDTHDTVQPTAPAFETDEIEWDAITAAPAVEVTRPRPDPPAAAPAAAPTNAAPRTARHAALPAGAKPRLVVKRREPSYPDLPPPSSQASPGPGPSGALPDPPSNSVIRQSPAISGPNAPPSPLGPARPPAPSGPDVVGARPPAPSGPDLVGARPRAPSGADLAAAAAAATRLGVSPGPAAPAGATGPGGPMVRPAAPGMAARPAIRPIGSGPAAGPPGARPAAIPAPGPAPAAAPTAARPAPIVRQAAPDAPSAPPAAGTNPSAAPRPAPSVSRRPLPPLPSSHSNSKK